jgi:hypothetical protein
MNLMFRDLYRSRPHLGMIYVAMKVSLPGS